MLRKTPATTTDLRQLAKRAESTVRANRDEAQRLLAFVRERMGEIAAAFYDGVRLTVAAFLILAAYATLRAVLRWRR